MINPLRNPLILVLTVLALLGGAYLFGRWDAPGKEDYQTQSFVDGFRAYRDRFNAMTRQLEQAQRTIVAGQKRERELAARRTATPRLVPASCAPWAENLSTCDSQVAVLKGSVAEASRILGLTDQARKADSARADSANTKLKRELGKGKILGIKLPSRRTSFAAGGILGSLATGGACLFLSR